MATEERDTVFVNLNGSAAEHVKECYGDLGWQVNGERSKKRRKSSVQVEFCRPHSIPDKDELILLQVRLDVTLNAIGKIAKSRRRRAAATGVCLGLAALLFIGLGAVIICMFSGAVAAVLGGLSCLFGVITAIFGGISAAKIYRLDCYKCSVEIDKKMEYIDEICQRARMVRGVNDEYQK